MDDLSWGKMRVWVSVLSRRCLSFTPDLLRFFTKRHSEGHRNTRYAAEYDDILPFCVV